MGTAPAQQDHLAEHRIHNNHLDKMRDLALLLLLAFANSASSHNCAGCTPLDTLAFDKVVNAFPASLVKFDVAYPYGDDHAEFAKVAKDAAGVDRLFIGEVGIKDYGEKDNEDLASRFEVKKEGFISKEEARVKKILTGKVNKERKEELEERVNILKSFLSAKSEDKDEL